MQKGNINRVLKALANNMCGGILPLSDEKGTLIQV